MARKRRCENKSYFTAKGSSLTFIGAANSSKCEKLIKAMEWPLHIEKVGSDVVAYFVDDWYKDELEYLRRCYGNYFGDMLLNENIDKNTDIVLANHIPSILPLRDNRTWEDVYEEHITSTERDDSGALYSSGSTMGGSYDKDEEPAIVKTYSINEYRANGYFN